MVQVLSRQMNNLTTDLAKVNHPPVKFDPLKSSKFLKSSFGSQGKDCRSFCAEWCDTTGSIMMLHLILHFVMCVCMVAEFEKPAQKGILPSSLLVLLIGKKQLQPLKSAYDSTSHHVIERL